jgi:glycopeptide antibiotics resistance protein
MSMLIFFGIIHLAVFAILLIAVLLGLWLRGKSRSYLFFAAIFGIYMIAVLSVVIFPIHIPQANSGFAHQMSFNLRPLHFGRCDFMGLCLRIIYENILLTVPFGFGISFLVNVKSKNVLWLAMSVGVVFELTQLLLSFIFHSPFRVIDINDIILNAMGILIGYAVFRLFGWLHLSIANRFQILSKYSFAYIYEVVRQSH